MIEVAIEEILDKKEDKNRTFDKKKLKKSEGLAKRRL